ncbi:hypothetical protein TCAL_00392 [Tigriopus californicus]|uniref:IGFBP N-terminal domain-containing protein n=1 Tax=Tigriopus californicus TaxID=6832 RepID=A0A553NE23_TIGCA|nr:cysteine-rich motor neuron 1 protein-like [Tigriopus californicus]TRY63697.1 hypothetical protein TCAL_00392 [Tigriopus californicus]|eukprot:TCALIF_00392-PA protein Name:"Protein of unknown function" AED:0.09 eAED:0.09 QI:0/-1/0/1/-1/1/1/0/191
MQTRHLLSWVSVWSVFLFNLDLCKASISCGRTGPDPECLDVYTHTPRNLPKCYCTDLCADKLSDLVTSCASGQLLADGCGACLICARALGQSCGGSFNVLGVCAGGLSCMVKFNPIGADPTAEEHAKVGVCVRDNFHECPKSTDKPQKEGVSCRPGRTGILSDALYCPTLRQPTRQGRLPTLLEILLGARN